MSNANDLKPWRMGCGVLGKYSSRHIGSVTIDCGRRGLRGQEGAGAYRCRFLTIWQLLVVTAMKIQGFGDCPRLPASPASKASPAPLTLFLSIPTT